MSAHDKQQEEKALHIGKILMADAAGEVILYEGVITHTKVLPSVLMENPWKYMVRPEPEFIWLKVWETKHHGFVWDTFDSEDRADKRKEYHPNNPGIFNSIHKIQITAKQ